MDDLSSLDWNGSKAAPRGQQTSAPKGNYYPTLRPTPPLSGRSTPNQVSLPSSAQKPASNAPTSSRGSTPANDSFANLVSFNASQSTKNLSLQEQQQKLQEEKTRQEADRRKAFDSQFETRTSSKSLWSALGDGRTTPNRQTSPPTYTATSEYGGQTLSKVINKPFAGIPPPSSSPAPSPVTDSEEDILAAFNASAPVDKSSHMPAPSKGTSYESKVNGSLQPGQIGERTINRSSVEDDDDPFGLGMGPSKGVVSENHAMVNGKAPIQDDDDVLGMLGRPVSEFPKPEPEEKAHSEPAQPVLDNPKVRALNELVEMGFEPAKCRRALDSTRSGADVQAAVGWLLKQAHEESKNTSKKPSLDSSDDGGSGGPRQPRPASKRRTSSTAGAAKPAWMKEQPADQRRQESRSPVKGDKDAAQYASEIGSSLFKTANSLWKTGQKKLNQAVSELNSVDSSDPNQPKWMREALQESSTRRLRSEQNDRKVVEKEPIQKPAQSERKPVQTNVTDEALLLEAGGGPPPRKKMTAKTKPEPFREPTESFRDETRARPSDHRSEVLTQPEFTQQARRDPRSKLSRHAVEEEAAGAYISPARRKRTAPKSQPAENEPDLLLNDKDSKAPQPTLDPNASTPAVHRYRPTSTKSLPTRPLSSQRTIPPISSIAVQSSTSSRRAGTEAFKRGDYGSATTEYTKALTAVPPSHPLTIVILANRALSHSKTGDPKASIADATTVIELIGPSRGVGETIDLGRGEGVKPMDIYWGKAMQRKAEELEHLERWTDAAAAWRSCVEVGVGGATSIAGRNRCESAARPKPPPAAKKAPPRPKPSALGDLAPKPAQSAEAVSRLRAANAAADKLDDEKFRLADIVDGRVSQWRAGKEGNLRALLASLENVLWEDAGWKKTGMGELIQTNKVKIVYMRGIAKVHPDKVRRKLDIPVCEGKIN